MFLNRISIRVSLVATVVVLGVLGLSLAVLSGRIYSDHAIDDARSELAEQLRLASQATDDGFLRQARALARTFERSAAAGDGRELHQTLQGLAQGFALAQSGTYAVWLTLHDGGPAPLVTGAAPGTGDDAGWQTACAPLLGRLPASGASVAGYCSAGGRLYRGAYVPVDTPVAGYLGVVTDAAAAFADMEAALELPLRVSRPDDGVVYQSAAWASADDSDHVLFAARTVEHAGGETFLLQAARDVAALVARLEQTRYAVLFAAAAVTLLCMLIAMAFLDRVALSPWRSLLAHLRAVERDENELGTRVAVDGNAEAAQLAESFNRLTARLKDFYRHLERVAFTDPLTQLPNRSLLHQRLEEAATAGRSENRTFALFVMDLDRFKEINNTLGHRIGDALLKQVATRLRARLRDTDTIARIGGDEFAVLLPTETRKQADTGARMLLQSLRAPFIVEGHQVDVGTSIGVALYPDHGVDAESLMGNADVAMYAAKQAGGGHMFYDPQMNRDRASQLALMGELRHAVEADPEQFVLYFQPKISLKTDRVAGFEALVRWRHPGGRLILPETFVPLLERTGLIRSLTAWVTHEALRVAGELRALGFELPIAVNISARDLHGSGLIEELAEQLALHQGLAQWIEVEITETAVMPDVGGAADLLAQLGDMGFRLIIDDFGTGYSSLAHLKKLPVQAIKIDKSFVANMVKDENDAAIVHTSIDLAHHLGLEVIAEGVDDEAVLSRLRARRCDAAQGIYLSRPLPAEEVTEWLAKSNWGVARPIASRA